MFCNALQYKATAVLFTSQEKLNYFPLNNQYKFNYIVETYFPNEKDFFNLCKIL